MILLWWLCSLIIVFLELEKIILASTNLVDRADKSHIAQLFY